VIIPRRRLHFETCSRGRAWVPALPRRGVGLASFMRRLAAVGRRDPARRSSPGIRVSWARADARGGGASWALCPRRRRPPGIALATGKPAGCPTRR